MRFFKTALIVALFLLAWPRAAHCVNSHVKVLLLPFDVFSAVDISETRRNVMDALASSLESKGVEIVGLEEVRGLVVEGGVESFDENTALEISGEVSADFALLGSLTRLGMTTNVEMRVFDLKGQRPVAFYSRSSVSEGELLRTLERTGEEVYNKMTATLMERPVVKTGFVDRIIVSGNRRVDTEAILKKITSGAGEAFSPDDVKEDIRALYGTGYFEDITVDLSDTASGKVLTYKVREMPFIRAVVITGSKEIKDETIREAITVKENTFLDRAAVGENAERIKDLYAGDGFYLAEVKPRIDSDGVEATVTFDIKEGREVRVKRITFIGNERFSDKELKKVMGTKQAWLFSVLTESGRFNEFLFQNDLAMVLGKYYDNGYINADILDHRVLLSEDKKWFYITIAVTEGGQFSLGAIDFTGDILDSRGELADKLKIKTGETFSRATLSGDLDTLSDHYGDKGYAFADIKPITHINAEVKTVDITFDIKKNELAYVERINITGNTRTRDKVIRREIESEEGNLYSSSEMKRSSSNLKRLGYFDDVRVSKARGTASDRVDLNVDVKERPTGSISAGIGYSSVDKLIGTASISQSNFMGTGIKLDISGTVSASSARYVVGFTQPWLFDKPLSAGVDLYNVEREYPDFKIIKNGFDIRFGFPVYGRYTRGYITYTLEEVDVLDVSDDASTFIKEQEGNNTESSIRLTLKRDTRNDYFFPTEGHVVTVSTELAGGPIGGTIYFIKNELDAVQFFPLPLDTSFSVRGSAGYLQGYAGREPPIYERYFLGGINSLRGFETRSIGPKDPETGDLIGGDAMLVTNMEFLFPIFPEQKIRGLLFFDAGNAYDGRIDLTDLRYGAGVGIRWFSPIGPLRLEWGFNLDRRDEEPSSQWDFTIGTAF